MIAHGKLCRKAVGVFTLSFVVVVVMRSAVFDEIVVRPGIYCRIGRIVTAELKACITVVVEFAVFNNVVAAAYIEAVVARAADIYIAPIIVVAIDMYAAVGRSETH